jgi:uncharacterized hydrophobic protein (TIGR00271 family)
MNEEKNPAHGSVQFSRTQGFLSATALGGSVVLAISIFVAGAHLVEQSGSDAPLVFGIAALLFLPIILSSVQRSSGAISSASFYSAARASGSPWRLFFTGWLMVAGYVSLGALLAHGTAIRVGIFFERVFGQNVAFELIMLPIVAIAFAKEALTKSENWRSRTVIFWACALFLIILAIAASIVRYRAGTSIPKTEPLQHWLIPISMLASTLWSIDIVLNYRGQFRNPNRTILWGLITTFWGGSLLAALISVALLNNPSLLMRNWLAVLTWNESRLELLILIAGFLICASGLLRAMSRINRLLGIMVLDDALPTSNVRENTAQYYSILFSVLLAGCAVFFSVTSLLIVSGFAALSSMLFYLMPLLKKDVSGFASISLPIHPLIPVFSILLSVFLIVILPMKDLFILGIWLIVGALLYITVTRKKMLPAMQQEQVLTEDRAKPLTEGYRILVCLNNEDEINESLVRVGSSIATAKNGELLILHVMETSESMPMSLQRKRGEQEWDQIQDKLQNLQLNGGSVRTLVRLAPDRLAGIKATSREFAPDFLLMEWPEEAVERLRKNQLQNLLQLTARPLGILRGQFNQQPKTLAIACGNSSHTTLALQMGEAIASVNASEVQAVRIFKTIESYDEANAEIQEAINKSEIKIPAKLVVHQEKEIEKGILKQTENTDLVVLGISDDPLSGRPLPDGQSIDVARQRKQATLIVKSKEESSRFLFRRLLAQLTNRVATLTTKERSELLSQLKVGLQARADFYLMVALAAVIAITGLIMNDGSIVLGAMLVSPLMSPIVGIACGIALGNVDLMRRSSASTFKGMALVLGVGALMTFFLPHVEPTDQILSRTHPGIYDMLAALAAGGAGAYSLGRKPVAGALPGVAMALSLEPPLATAGYGLSTSQFWIAGGAFLLFLTNLAAIVLSGVGVYMLLGLRPPKKEGISLVGKAVAAVVIATLILLVPLGLGTYGSIQRGRLKFHVETQFRDEALRERFELLDLKISEHDNGFMIHPTVLSSEEVTPEKIERFRKTIQRKVGSPIQIEATILKTTKIESPLPQANNEK